MSAFKEQYPLNKDYPIRISHHDKCGGFPPPHYHRALEVVYCLKGPVKMEVNHSLYTLDTGDMIIVGSNHIHSYIPNYPSSTPESSTSDERYYMLIFDWDHLESIYKDKELFGNLNSVLLKSQVFRATQIDTQNYRQLFDDMYNEITGQRTGYKLAIISDLYRFLIFATRNSVPQLNTENDLTSLKKEHQFISLVNDYIFSNYTRPPLPPLKEMAEISGYSHYHFSRLFKKYIGTTFKEYLINFRVNMVKEDLYDESMSITDAAFKNGFASIKTFNRCFKDLTGKTPREYKKAINDHFEANSDK